jgi:hypothetical protein
MAQTAHTAVKTTFELQRAPLNFAEKQQSRQDLLVLFIRRSVDVVAKHSYSVQLLTRIRVSYFYLAASHYFGDA